jgi:Na+-transporting methylmalonyl-CoA/oxaloacetate decarboxylase gamma subunit
MSKWVDTFASPEPGPDPYDEAVAQPEADESELDPVAAAAILVHASRHARRDLDIRPPLLLFAGR